MTMRVVLLCATRRGFLVLKRLKELLPTVDLVVFSFREDPWEPPFMADIQTATVTAGGIFFEARQLGSDRLQEFWRNTAVDLMLAVNWRYMIPKEIYQRPRRGTFVFHDSLLPEYRGFSPTVWAMINGEDHTGATLFEISEAVDEGDIVDQELIPIGQDDAISTVLERVTDGYLNLLTRNVKSLLSGVVPRRSQDHSLATYTCKRCPEDNRIDWRQSSTQIHNLIRALSAPYPGAHTTLEGRELRIWSAERLSVCKRYVGRVPGRIIEVRPGQGSVVLTGDGALLLKQVQPKEGDPCTATEVLKSLGQTLGS